MFKGVYTHNWTFTFYCLISKILKLKGIRPLEDEYPYPKPSPINIRTLNASIGHSRKGIKTETSASYSGSHSSSSFYDEKLDNIMAFVHDISIKMSGLVSLLHHHTIRCDTKFTSLQTQLDQIQRKLEENEDKLTKKGEMLLIGGEKAWSKGEYWSWRAKERKVLCLIFCIYFASYYHISEFMLCIRTIFLCTFAL